MHPSKNSVTVRRMIENIIIEYVAIRLLALIAICMVIRFTYYHLKLRAISQHLNSYFRILEEVSENKSDMNAHAELAERWPEITKLFGQAHFRLVFGHRVGISGFQPTGSISVWDSLGERGDEQRRHILEAFYQTKGFFRARRNETLSPVFCIESFLNWPKTLLGRLGFNIEGAFAQFLKIVVLILEIVGCIFFVLEEMH